jgi:hypothetical protein
MIFLNIFQDVVRYSSLTKKRKAIMTILSSLLYVNKDFYRITREYSYYFTLKFTVKKYDKKNIRAELWEAIDLTLKKEYTMKNFNTFKKYKRDNGFIGEYSRHWAMYYYIMYLDMGFEDKKNNWSVLRWYQNCIKYDQIPEVFCKYTQRLVKEYPEEKEEILKFLRKASFVKDKEACEILIKYHIEGCYNLIKDSFLLDFYSRIVNDKKFRLDNYFERYFIK